VVESEVIQKGKNYHYRKSSQTNDKVRIIFKEHAERLTEADLRVKNFEIPIGNCIAPAPDPCSDPVGYILPFSLDSDGNS
jgi:hypothetical protein